MPSADSRRLGEKEKSERERTKSLFGHIAFFYRERRLIFEIRDVFSFIRTMRRKMKQQIK